MGVEYQGDMYLLLVDGEVEVVGAPKEYILQEALSSLRMRLNDHYAETLPRKVDQDFRDELDLEVHKLTDETMVELPLQEWVDAYYEEAKASEKEDEEREYQLYLRLHEKYKARRR